MLPYFTRLRLAVRSFFGVLDYARVPEEVLDALGAPDTRVRTPPIETPPAARAAAPAPAPAARAPAPAPPTPPVDEGVRAAQMLALLQRDGRLIDFLMEDIAPYADAQIGAAVRDVHAGSRQALLRYMALTPVLDGEEGSPVTVPEGTGASAVKVIGNVTGAPPYRGLLRHRGWRASRLDLPLLPASDHLVIAPAEVEIP